LIMDEQCARLPDGRLHLHHGPIDLVIQALGEPAQVAAAYRQAEQGFQGLLAAMVDELALLRRPLGETPPALHGPVTRRMGRAAWQFRGSFVTPMAAVAGAVADEMLERLTAGRRLQRAYVNDGGDIALYLAPGERFRSGLVSQLQAPRVDGVCVVEAAMPVRGIATSGWRGRSFSFGIADAVTVLAGDAASADVAATLIANAVNLAHPAVRRLPARELDEDSDLGEQAVTVAVGELEAAAVALALDRGAALARDYWQRGLIHGAALALAGQWRILGHVLGSGDPLP